jgi:tryptophan halogenase
LINRVIVLGGGSAGFLCSMGLKMQVPDLQVRVIRSREIGIIGVGEGSTIPLTRYIHHFLGIDIRQFVRMARPTWKLGMRFLNWGPRDHYYFALGAQLDQRLPNLPRNIAFYCDEEMDYATPLSSLMAHGKIFQRAPGGTLAWHWDFAYHVENQSFVQCLENLARAAGVEIVDDTVREVRQDESGVSGLVMESGRTETADLYVDCSGFRSVLLGQTFREPFVSFKSTLYCDRAIVGGWERSDEPVHPFTTCQTMDSGWCWQIELENRINRGYVYSSSFISDTEAEAEFRRKNPRLGPTRIVKFVSGRYERGWIKNVVAIGNSGGFVEPLEATALGIIARQSRILCEILMETSRQVPPEHVNQYNNYHARVWDGIRRILSIHYRFNTGQQQTPFWQACKNDVDLAGAEPVVESYSQCGPNSMWGPMLIDPVDPFGPSGYLTLMVGQKLPTKVRYRPSSIERATWDAEQQRYRSAALQGVTVRESLTALLEEPH